MRTKFSLTTGACKRSTLAVGAALTEAHSDERNRSLPHSDERNRSLFVDPAAQTPQSRSFFL